MLTQRGALNKQEKMTPLHFSLHLLPHFSGPLFRKILQKSSLYLLSPIPLLASSLELAPLRPLPPPLH